MNVSKNCYVQVPCKYTVCLQSIDDIDKRYPSVFEEVNENSEETGENCLTILITASYLLAYK